MVVYEFNVTPSITTVGDWMYMDDEEEYIILNDEYSDLFKAFGIRVSHSNLANMDWASVVIHGKSVLPDYKIQGDTLYISREFCCKSRQLVKVCLGLLFPFGMYRVYVFFLLYEANYNMVCVVLDRETLAFRGSYCADKRVQCVHTDAIAKLLLSKPSLLEGYL